MSQSSIGTDILNHSTCTLAAGLDYLAREMQLTFSPGDFEKRVSIPLIDDKIQEGQELLFITLHSPVSSLTVELPPNSVIYIVDNDPGLRGFGINFVYNNIRLAHSESSTGTIPVGHKHHNNVGNAHVDTKHKSTCDKVLPEMDLCWSLQSSAVTVCHCRWRGKKFHCHWSGGRRQLCIWTDTNQWSWDWP